MGLNKSPDGVTFKNNPNTIEYQLFPGEFFSGSDTTIYFGDIFVSDISGIQFTLNENVNPIFGYASRTWDDVSRGTRYVEGFFKIPFSEAGYIESIMSHIALIEKDNKSDIGIRLSGDTPDNKWVAETKETIEEFLERRDIHFEDKEYKVDNYLFTDKFPIKPGDYGPHIKEIRRLMEKAEKKIKLSGGDIKTGMGLNDTNMLRKFIRQRYGEVNSVNCNKFCKDMKQTNINGGECWDTWEIDADNLSANKTGGLFVKRFQSRLNFIISYLYNNDSAHIRQKLGDGKFGHITTDRAIELCTLFKVNRENKNSTKNKLIASRDKNISQDNSLRSNNGRNRKKGSPRNRTSIVKPCEMVQELVGFHVSSDDYLRYSADMYDWLRRFRCYHKRGWDFNTRKEGYMYKEDIILLYNDAGEEYMKTKTKVEKVNRPATPGNSERRFANYEKDVWGREFSHDDQHQFETFFYTERSNGNVDNVQEVLKKTGFNIYITYGPMPEAIELNNRKIPKNYNFNTTVKGIKNVQLKSVGQMINADGRPIEEVYYFIGQDLD